MQTRLNQRLQFKILALLISSLLIACSEEKETTSSDSCNDAPKKTEESYCSSVKSFTDPVTITGTAVYERRAFTAFGLGGKDSTNYPIRYAEVVVKNSSGTIIQCGETDASGNFSLNVGRSSSSHTIEVRSRGKNSVVYASVLNDHSNMKAYKVSSNVTPNSAKAVGTLTAKYNSTLEGGAFNIFDKIVSTNLYLQTQTNNCSSTHSNCSSFVANKKIQVLWKKGFDPGEYFCGSGVSFYVPDTSRMYILGGSNGDTDNTDTDHFDNTIIVHEYGHFLEDLYAKSSSPGGEHDANSIVDPRLAWSEAWATFLAVSVLGDPYYRDTSGNSDGSTRYVFPLVNLETNGTGVNSRDPKYSEGYTVQSGEGNFREFRIVRALNDAIDSNSDTMSDSNSDNKNISFAEFWTIFNGSNGIKNSSYRFSNMGLFGQLHDSLSSGTDITNILSAESILPNLTDYATALQTGTCNGVTITPADSNNKSENGTFTNSNLFASNDFYQYYHSGGTLNVSLTYSTTSGDLDLFVYADGYTYGSDSHLVLSSYDENDGGSEAASTTLPAGYYMINIMAYTANSMAASTYNLSVNSNGGTSKCP